MIKLVISNCDGNSELEKALAESDLQFQVVFDVENYGLTPPHLIVDGIPLDEKRSLKWVKSHSTKEI